MLGMMRLRWVWTGVAGTPWYTNLYVAGDSLGEAQAQADLQQDFFTGFSFQLSSNITIALDPFVPVVDASDGQIQAGYTVNTPPAVTGQEGGDMLPRQANSLTTFSTGVYVGGRQIKGKCFLGGYTVASSDGDGHYDETRRNAVELQWQTYIDGGSTLVVWSKKNGASAAVTDATVAQQWATINSRRD